MRAAVVVDRDAIARIHPKLPASPSSQYRLATTMSRSRGLALLEQRGDQLRRVLKVGVHDADPRAARHAHALKNRRAQPADAPLGRLRHAGPSS